MSLTWVQKAMLRRLLKKESPDSYTTSSPEEEQMGYDFVYVHGSTNEHKDALILSWDEQDDSVNYMWWPEDARGVRGTESKCTSSDILWESLNVRQRYRTWDIRYSTLQEAYLHDIFRLPLVKWRVQKIRNVFLRPVSADHRMGLLKTIVKMYDKQEPITTHELLAKIHGSAIRLSGEYYRLQKNLEFLLDSLKESGDLIYKDENDPIHFFGHGAIAPTPKSLLTIATHNEDSQRHKDMVKMSKRQLWVGWAMFALAAATLTVELGKLFELWK
jgi:hypothetical protein